MNLVKISNELREYGHEEVSIFIQYLRDLETAKNAQGQPRNPWFKYFKEEQAITLFKKVALDGLNIDGDTIIIVNKGKPTVSYNYQAYKNKVLQVYPDARFDIQNVYKGDTFSFKKESGVVKYNHEITDPFSTERKLIGCYCIIKIASRGEFIETLNLVEINKIRSVAKTQKIWQTWFEEMTLKSVIKRACKRHFKDIVKNIEKLDNENYDVEAADLEFHYHEGIEACNSTKELQVYYENNIAKVGDEKAFLKKLTERKIELLE